jgi:hypothetical protein
VAWIEPNLSETKMMAARVDSKGDVIWQKPVFKALPGKNYFTPHKFAADGKGGRYVMWFTSKAVGFDMSIQHLDLEGNLLFGDFGLQLTDFKWWGDFRLIPHNSGGVVVLYSGSKNNDNNASEYDLFTNYISPEGVFGLEQKLTTSLNQTGYCPGETISAELPEGVYSAQVFEGDSIYLLGKGISYNQFVLPNNLGETPINSSFLMTIN